MEEFNARLAAAARTGQALTTVAGARQVAAVLRDEGARMNPVGFARREAILARASAAASRGNYAEASRLIAEADASL